MSTRASKPTKTGPALMDRNDGTGWWNLLVDGHVTYAGPEKQCRRRYAILVQPSSRDLQDHNLKRAIWPTR